MLVHGDTHHATHDETRDDPAIGPTAFIVAVFVIVTIITVLALQAYFGRVESEEEQVKLIAPPSELLMSVRAEQRSRLSSYRWVAPDSGIVALPIERAMELVASEMSARGQAPTADSGGRVEPETARRGSAAPAGD